MHWTDLISETFLMTEEIKEKFPKLKHIKTLIYDSEFPNRSVELYQTVDDFCSFIIETEDYEYLVDLETLQNVEEFLKNYPEGYTEPISPSFYKNEQAE